MLAVNKRTSSSGREANGCRIKAGRLLPSAIPRRLGTYSRKNRLYFAFRELAARSAPPSCSATSDRSTPGARSACATNKSEHFNRYAQ
jgi:hypothetical protein